MFRDWRPKRPMAWLSVVLAASLYTCALLTVTGEDSAPPAVAPSAPGQSATDPMSQQPTPEEGRSTEVSTDQPTGPRRALTPQERYVILDKGTEPPFTGKYTDHFAAGIYACRQCGAMLYRSDSKFHSGCGWPSFDEEIPGAVRRVPDADGRRTEIVCANCGGHLGHVFLGEGFTEKNTRHCVNSISLDFIPQEEVTCGRAIFAGGCFWGVEYWLQEQPGVLETTVGYTGGFTENPTYEQLHSQQTGHAEAVEVLFDPVRTSFENLARVFFEIHDPTQVDGQGPDLGPEYRSAIFYLDEDQKAVAERLIAELRQKGINAVTQVVPAGRFWPAEAYHQNYLRDRNARPSCHFRRKVW